MIDAGVQSLEQIRQLAGMRGLMVKPDSLIFETPITANFREGMDVHQYFISAHGARKGLTDSALKTVHAGYLTRRLVDVAQDVIITEQDCGTSQGLTLTPLNGQVIKSFHSRLLGRVVAEDIYHHKTAIIQAGTLLDENHLKQLEENGINHVKVRSPITCQSEHSVCAMCYGQDLARGNLVNIGEAIGVVAAQSIGESGNQLTLRTHHMGGVAYRTAAIDSIEVKSRGVVKFENIKLVRQRLKTVVKGKKSQTITVALNGEIKIVDKRGKERECHKVPYGAVVFVKEGEQVNAGQQIASWDSHTSPIISEFAGYIRFVDALEGITLNREIDEKTGLNTLVVKEPKQWPIYAIDWQPMITIVDKSNNALIFDEQPVTYLLPPHSIINLEEGAKVNVGEVIARLPIEPLQNGDVSNGLPRIIDLFEARIPKKPAILALRSGVVSFGKETKTKHHLLITDKNKQQEDHPIPKWRQIKVVAGQEVEQGEIIADGKLNPHDILRLKGVDEVAKYLLNEMQQIYLNHGITINDKHFEVIIRQMLRTVTIVNQGDTSFLSGEIVRRSKLLEENQRLAQKSSRSKKQATWEPKLLGITKASLATESFISAASFMDTTRVLLNSAISGKSDNLRGLKENVVIGRLIPAGTGLSFHNERQDHG